MKKIVAITMAAIMGIGLFSLVGCGKNAPSGNGNSAKNTPAAVAKIYLTAIADLDNSILMPLCASENQKNATILVMTECNDDEFISSAFRTAEKSSEEINGDTAKVVYICKKDAKRTKDLIFTLDMKKIDGAWKIALLKLTMQ